MNLGNYSFSPKRLSKSLLAITNAAMYCGLCLDQDDKLGIS
jgi:hypothetical protein